jgi:hypothetical protein
MDMRRLLLVASVLVASALAAQSASPSATRVAPLVGRWQRTTTCQELVIALTKAGLGALAPYAWQGQTSATGQGSFKPGSAKPTKARPCSGAVPRRHSHFFDRQGQFGSLDWLGGQVDDGPYRITDQQTVHIGTNPAANFRFRILNGNKLTLTPVLTKAMVRRALAHPAKFSAASWAVSVAYAGHTWQRVPCNGRC